MSNINFLDPCNFKLKIFKCVVRSVRNAKSHKNVSSLNSSIYFLLSIMNISISSRRHCWHKTLFQNISITIRCISQNVS